MGIYRDHVLPRLVDVALNTEKCCELRQRSTRGLFGEVLEIGFGSGLNLPHYPQEVKRIYAVDPAVIGRKLATRRIEACPVPVEFIGLNGDALPLDSDRIDAALSTWTLCTISDVRSALEELLRVLKPGGELHFLEHGRSPDVTVARWQDRFAPLWKVLFGGCHVDRQIDDLLRDAGFEIKSLENFYTNRTKFGNYMYQGLAVKPE